MRSLVPWIGGVLATLGGMLGALWLWAIIGSVVRFDAVWVFAYIGLAAAMLIGCALGLAAGLVVARRLHR